MPCDYLQNFVRPLIRGQIDDDRSFQAVGLQGRLHFRTVRLLLES